MQITGQWRANAAVVTVLQRKNDVYECQEYQTIDQMLETLDLTIICRQLTQPYERGVGT